MYPQLVEHLTINFVDDSTNLISFKNASQMEDYLEEYYNLLDNFYTINKLKINNDKTELLISCKANMRVHIKNISFFAKGYKIVRKDKIKILGAYISFDLNYDHTINNMISKMHNRIYQVKKIIPFTNFKTRLSVINSIVMGVLFYILPIHYNCTNNQLKKLHKVVMTAAKTVMGYGYFKMSNIKILEKCQWLSIYNLLRYSSIVFLYKIKIYKEPTAIYNLYSKKHTERILTKQYTIYNPKYSDYKKFVIYAGNDLFNSIPESITSLSPNFFSLAIKKYITDTFHPFKWKELNNYESD